MKHDNCPLKYTYELFCDSLLVCFLKLQQVYVTKSGHRYMWVVIYIRLAI